MAKQFLSGLRLANLASDPQSGSEGELYFNTTTKTLKIYSNGVWSEVQGSGSASNGGGASISVSTTPPSSPSEGDAWFDNSQGSLYVYDGSFWVEAGGVLGSSDLEYIQDGVSSLFIHNDHTNISAIYSDPYEKILLSASGSLVSIDSITTPNYITFDTTYISPSAGLTPGSVYWNTDDQTLDVSLENEVVLQLGQEEFYPPLINTSGSQINRGQLVMVTGVQGDKLEIATAVADGSVPFDYIIGFAVKNIPNNSDVGRVIKFGYLRNIDTSSYNIGTILYPDPNNPGGLTSTKPEPPGYRIPIAIVTKQGNSGVILVRMALPSALGETDTNVKITNVQDEDILIYNSASGIWINTQIDALPDQTGNDGKYLTTDGTDASWETLDLSLYLTTASASDLYTTKLVSFTSATGAAYTLQLSDLNKMVELNHSSAIGLTVPTNETTAFPIGTRIDILQTGAGQVTVGGAGVTINGTPGLKLRTQWSGATLTKRETDPWVI
ncbi:MAG: hypothetical protein ACO295_03370, partial [Sediminibacterium sp.]